MLSIDACVKSCRGNIEYVERRSLLWMTGLWTSRRAGGGRQRRDVLRKHFSLGMELYKIYPASERCPRTIDLLSLALLFSACIHPAAVGQFIAKVGRGPKCPTPATRDHRPRPQSSTLSGIPTRVPLSSPPSSWETFCVGRFLVSGTDESW